jgi:hypothetical protein
MPTTNPISSAQPILNSVNVDPRTGKPLFSGQMEDDIKAGVQGTKKKNFNLISKVMLSKEAQEMIKKGAENPQPNMRPMTLATTLDTVLQRLIMAENDVRPGTVNQPVRFSNTPYGDLQIQVGPNIYNSVDEVPPGRIKDLMQQAIASWQESM